MLDIGLNAKTKRGSNVSLCLVEDGVTAARKSEFGNRLLDADLKKRGLVDGEIIDGISKLNLDDLTNRILESEVTLVF